MLKSTFVTMAAVFVASSAQCATYIPIPPVPGSASQIAFGINDDNVIAGSYVDSNGTEHGFVGPIDGSSYQPFDYGQGFTGTEPRAISKDGDIDGFAPGNGYQIGEEFYRNAHGFTKAIKRDGNPLDGVAQGINTLNVGMGDYYDAGNVRVGYYAARGKYKKDFKLGVHKWLQNSPRALNNDGTVVGFFVDKRGAEHGFIQDGKKAQIIDYPNINATLTVLEDGQRVNGDFTVTGQWNDANGNPHAFVLDLDKGNFKTIDPQDGSTFQQAWGMNGTGLVVFSTNNGTSYVYCPFKKAKCPAGGVEHADAVIHVAPATFLKHDRYGQTARNLPPAGSIPRHGAIQ